MKYTIQKIDKTNIDEDLFKKSCHKIVGLEQGLMGIGTLSEKTVHAVLKYYYAPNTKYHEIKINSFVADICREGEIYEIQSKSFYTMKNKLECFLQDYDVTIVYPIPVTKYLKWIDPDTGEVTGNRKSNKKGHIFDIIPELYSVKQFLSHENLHFILCFIEMEEYKLLDGYSKDRKKGATKTDRIPTKILGEFYLNNPKDYLNFLPGYENGKPTKECNIPQRFTTKDIALLCNCHISYIQILCNLLTELNLIKKVGSSNRYYLYEII